MLLAVRSAEKTTIIHTIRRAIGRFSLIASCTAIGTTGFAAPGRVPLVVADTAETEAVIKQVPLTGTVTSPTVGRLSTEVSGQVESIEVDIGDSVKRGSALLELDSEIEALNLRAARAATEEARAQLADAQRRFESAKRLRKQKTISQDEVDQREAEVNITKAVVERRLAEQQKQQARVERHAVKAPFAGVISDRMTDVGEWVEPGTPVLTLVAIDDLHVDFQVPQEFYPHIDDSSEVLVTLDAIPNRKFTAIIDAAVPVSDPNARTFLMRVTLDEKDLNITPGMSAHGTLRLNTGRRGVVVSRDAILRYPDGRVTVWVVNQGSETTTVSEQPVTVGHSFDGKVSITRGLKAGTVVVVEGNEALQEGQTVLVQSNP
ncbi:MAG: efflux RND transporter periplasmic adaptor subunit [Gammaproteobacteria bacterium]|jgi:RND family efflux transporter MFP subunit